MDKVELNKLPPQVLDLIMAYKEMLALYLPDERHVQMLDELDDDQNSGIRAWPAVRTPRMYEVRRWLKIGGAV